MRANLFPAITLFACLMVTTASVFAGPGTSGGGDRKALDSGSAWFLGKDKTIRTCYELGAEFGATPGALETAIVDAFAKWKTYTELKKVFAGLRYSEPNFKLHSFIPTMNVQLMKSCDGSEDLKFYFGSANAEVLSAKSSYENPIAFAHRVSYDLKKGWGKGFIWVAEPKLLNDPHYPNPSSWQNSTALQGILTHELGHVFGCEHVPGTIMTDNIAGLVLNPQVSGLELQDLNRIDGYKELYFCEDCEGKHEGTLSEATEKNKEPDTFKVLMGREPVGKVRSNYHALGEYPEGSHASRGYEFTISDELGSKTFPLIDFFQAIYFPGPLNLFNATASDKQGNTGKVNFHVSTGRVFQGRMMTATGQSVTVTISHNGHIASVFTNPSSIQATFIHEGKQYPLFYKTL